MTLLPDTDPAPDPDEDEDDTSTPTTTLGVVQPVLPPEQATNAIRKAADWVADELARLRDQRTEQDRDGLAEIKAKQTALIEQRRTINARIKALVAEQDRLARLVRVLDHK